MFPILCKLCLSDSVCVNLIRLRYMSKILRMVTRTARGSHSVMHCELCDCEAHGWQLICALHVGRKVAGMWTHAYTCMQPMRCTATAARDDHTSCNSHSATKTLAISCRVAQPYRMVIALTPS